MTVDSPVTVVAEAARGFEGDPTLARLLVRAARAGSADVVKFQLVLADELATRDYEYYDLFKQLEMSVGEWESVAEVARAVAVRVWAAVCFVSGSWLSSEMTFWRLGGRSEGGC